MFKTTFFAIILVIIGGFILGCSPEKSLLEPEDNLHSTFTQQEMISELGPVISPSIGNYGTTSWHIRIVFGHNEGNSVDCPYWGGICVFIDDLFSVAPILNQSEIDAGIGIAKIDIINNQVRLQLKSPGTIYGMFPINDDLILSNAISNTFGFSYCRIIHGLYTVCFNDPNYPNGVVYVDAETQTI